MTAEAERFAGAALDLGRVAYEVGERTDPGLRVEAFEVAFAGIGSLYAIGDQPGDPTDARRNHGSMIHKLQEDDTGTLRGPLSVYAAQLAEMPTHTQKFLARLHDDLADVMAERRELVYTAAGLVDALKDEATTIGTILSIHGGTTQLTREPFEDTAQRIIHAGRLQGAFDLERHRRNGQAAVPPTTANKLHLAKVAIGFRRYSAVRRHPHLVRAARDLTPADAPAA